MDARPLPGTLLTLAPVTLALVTAVTGAASPSVTQPAPATQVAAFATEVPWSAEAFVDTIGINVHLHNSNTIYGDFPLISQALFDLGIRHIRDGLINTTWQEYYRRHSLLAAHGIHCIFITGTDDTDEQMRLFSQRVGGAVEGFEAPNEYDRTGGPDWAPQLMQFVPRLHALAATIPPRDKVFVVGPSLTRADSWLSLPGLSRSFDFINIHNYFGGHDPGTPGWGDDSYGSIAWNLALAQKAWGRKPVMTTETGYLTDLGTAQSIPEDVDAAYVPRIFLEQAMHGIRRTYLYELADGNDVIPFAERSFGMVRNDGSRKPAFTALQRFLSLLVDPGPAFQPQPVELQVHPGAPTELHHLLLQKRDGFLYFAFWLEASGYDQTSRCLVEVQPVRFQLQSRRRIDYAQLYSLDPRRSAAPAAVPSGNSVDLVARGTVSILKFTLVR